MFGLRLKKPIGTAYATDGDDVVKIKTALRDLGEYQPPAFGITPHADSAMFEGLRHVQKKAGLTVDGVAKPGGPTELTLNADLARKTVNGQAGNPRPVGGPSPSRSRAPSDGGTVRADSDIVAIGKRLAQQGRAGRQGGEQGGGQGATPGKQPGPARGQGLRLRGGVGVNQPNGAADIAALKTALAWTGHYPTDRARLTDPRHDEDLHWGLIGFQRDFNLTQDGFARPGGETETRLNTLIEPLIQLASFTTEDAGAAGGDRVQANWFNAQEERSSPSARRDSGVQVAEAGGAWSNPTAWALEQAGRQAGKAVEKAAESVADDEPGQALKEQSPEYAWQDKPAISGRRDGFSFDTDGAVQVRLRTATLGVDGVRFFARWSELDDAGNVVQELWSEETWNKGDPRRQEHRKHVPFGVGREFTIEPPFESKSSRYRVDIVVPPSEAFHGNSAGVDMSIHAQRGKAVREVK